jgi:hypothetical protein
MLNATAAAEIATNEAIAALRAPRQRGDIDRSDMFISLCDY